MRTMHQYKIRPPTYDGNYSQFEEWKYPFTANAGLINAAFPRLLAQAEGSQQAITDQLLIDGAATPAEEQLWTRLSAELQFIFVSTTKAAAATVWRHIHRRFSIPVGQEASGTSPNSLSHLLRSIASKKLLHHGSLRSTDMKGRTQSPSQTPSR